MVTEFDILGRLPVRLGPSQYQPSKLFPGINVRISDDARRAVVFLGVEDDTPGGIGVRCVGTAFFIVYDGHPYLVTAKHNVLPLEGAPYIIRLNLVSGEADNIYVNEFDHLPWYSHSDPNVDLAIAPFFYDPNANGWNIAYLTGLESLSDSTGHMCGDFCYTIGLFQLLTGKKRNLPVVHSGNLALIPGDETIPVLDWEKPGSRLVRQVTGYLVEQQGIAGLSGAPVFARNQIELEGFTFNDNDGTMLVPTSRLSLLGVWQAAWDAPPDEVRAVGIPGNVKVPIGMGVVVPAIRIREILDMPIPAKQRDDRRQKQAAAAAASPQSAFSDKPSDSSLTHREDFNRLLEAASKTPPSKG